MDPVRAISLAGLCLLLLGLVLSWTTGEIYSWLIITPVVIIAGVYTLGPQLRWWYWQRNPPDLPTDLAPLLERFDLYRRLDLAGKREFRRRTFLLREGTRIEGQAIEEIPPDVAVMVAASAATVSFHREEFLIGETENVIFYRHQFPSPRHDELHSSEFHGPDGVIIWKLNTFLRSVVEPDKYLQLGIYEWARALFYHRARTREQLESRALDYAAIESVSGFSEVALKQFIGLPELDRTALTTVLYFTHREGLRQREPGTFDVYAALFK